MTLNRAHIKVVYSNEFGIFLKTTAIYVLKTQIMYGNIENNRFVSCDAISSRN